MQFDKKVLLITGAGTGIGKDTALAFAKAKGRVVMGGRREAPLKDTAQEIRSSGGDAVFMPCDVSHPAEVEALVQLAIREYGRLDFAFNNAGIEGPSSPLHQQDIQEVDDLLRINLNGMFYCLKYEIHQMLKNGGGSIVNHSSICGLQGLPNCSLYVASKHGIVGMTKSAALDYARHNIRINAIAPGPIRTPLHERNTGGKPDSAAAMVPMARIGEPEEVTNCVLWLLSDSASYITGQTIAIDGGMVAR